MPRLTVAGLCVAVLVAGFLAGRITGRQGVQTTTVVKTVDRPVVVAAQHVGSASDARGAGPLDVVRVSSVRQDGFLRTTIVTRDAWRDGLVQRGGRYGLSILYDTNGDGRADRTDVVFFFDGKLTSWISSLGQGVQYAEVTRPSATTITVDRDASVFFDAAGEAGLLQTQPIGVAVVARRPGGTDRVPDSGWILVPAPATQTAPPTTTFAAPQTSTTHTTCVKSHVTTATLQREIAAIRAASKLPTPDTLKGNAAINRATDAFLRDVELAPIGDVARNRWIDHAMGALNGKCEQCFQGLEAARPVVGIKFPTPHC